MPLSPFLVIFQSTSNSKSPYSAIEQRLSPLPLNHMQLSLTLQFAGNITFTSACTLSRSTLLILARAIGFSTSPCQPVKSFPLNMDLNPSSAGIPVRYLFISSLLYSLSGPENFDEALVRISRTRFPYIPVFELTEGSATYIAASAAAADVAGSSRYFA